MIRTFALATCSLWISTASVAQPGIPEGITRLAPNILDTAPERILENTAMWTIKEGVGGRAGGVEVFKSTDGRFSVGTYKYAKFTLQIKNYPSDEFMHIIAGRVTIIDATGAAHTYGPGHSFVMKRGFTGTWKQLEPVKKIAVSYEPDK